MAKRVFLIVLDSFGIGEMPDSHAFGDEGSNTLGAIRNNENFNIPNLISLGLFNIDGVGGGIKNPKSCYAKMAEKSKGKDTTVGHWELAGLISQNPLPTYPNGFPKEIISKFEEKTGRKTLCNKPYSGTEVIKDYGEEHIKTGAYIVYTSADSVFQIAAHEEVIPLSELYKACLVAREILVGEHGVGRVIARPFTSKYPFKRTANRHDYSLIPPRETMLSLIKKAGKDCISIGKINDIFAGVGITKKNAIKNNLEGIEKTIEIMDTNFEGLCFTNLVDFDMVYGHRNDVDGYAKAISEFDLYLDKIISKLKKDDMLIITADHGCDPSTESTDHSREYTPMLLIGDYFKEGVNLNTRDSFSDISATILEYLGVDKEETDGVSFLSKVIKKGN